MNLSDLLQGIYLDSVSDQFSHYYVEAISTDSRTVQPHSLFVALKGSAYDGMEFIPEVIDKGVRVMVSEDHPKEIPADVCWIKVENIQEFLRLLLKKFYGNPSQKLKTIGITGTNGKTTVSYLLASILKAAGQKYGLLGTIQHQLGEKILPSRNTTPGIVENQIFLSELHQNHIEHCIMEVSSHALKQGRVDLIDFQTAVFTNLTPEHLDYHKDMDDYFAAKTKLFQGLSNTATAVINQDDEYARKLPGFTNAKILRYGLAQEAEVTATDINFSLTGTQCRIHSPTGEITVRTKLIGRHNIYNILAAVSVAVSQGIPLEHIQQGIDRLDTVPGRLERVDCGEDFLTFVDYAHTDDALVHVLKTLKQMTPGRLMVVFGCGGDRDREKRAKMGNAADQWADWSIITTDNPRGEDPPGIAQQIVFGFKSDRYEVILDRQDAIHKALALAQNRDTILIAGKGHEDYQIFADQTIHFDDREVVRDYFKITKHQDTSTK